MRISKFDNIATIGSSVKFLLKEKRVENLTSKKKYADSINEKGSQASGEMIKPKNHAMYLEALNEEINAKAHAIYRERGDKPGSQISDWLKAEKEIYEKYGIHHGKSSRDLNG